MPTESIKSTVLIQIDSLTASYMLKAMFRLTYKIGFSILIKKNLLRLHHQKRRGFSEVKALYKYLVCHYLEIHEDYHKD